MGGIALGRVRRRRLCGRGSDRGCGLCRDGGCGLRGGRGCGCLSRSSIGISFAVAVTVPVVSVRLFHFRHVLSVISRPVPDLCPNPIPLTNKGHE